MVEWTSVTQQRFDRIVVGLFHPVVKTKTKKSWWSCVVGHMNATRVVSTSQPSPDWIVEDSLSGCWHLFEVADMVMASRVVLTKMGFKRSVCAWERIEHSLFLKMNL